MNVVLRLIFKLKLMNAVLKSKNCDEYFENNSINVNFIKNEFLISNSVKEPLLIPFLDSAVSSRVVASSSLLFNSASISYSSAQPQPPSSSQLSCLFRLPLPIKLQHLFVFFLFLFLGAVRDIGDRESSLRRGTALQITQLRRRRGCPHLAQRCDDEPGHVYRWWRSSGMTYLSW